MSTLTRIARWTGPGVFGLLLLAAGCTDPYQEPIEPDESPTPIPVVSAPRIELDPTSLDFGEVEVSSSATLDIELRNAGNAVLDVTEVAITEGDAYALLTDPGPFQVQPGDFAAVTVQFAPVDSGEHAGLLQVSSTDESNPVLTVTLLGSAELSDLDGDGYSEQEDCNDNDASIYPGAMELCDEVDNDCDDEIDEEVASVFYLDDDDDGYGDDAQPLEDCNPPSGYVENDEDCDDANDDVYPGAWELCDGLDNDCDGAIDDADTEYPTPADTPDSELPTWYEDADLDGYGVAATSSQSCSKPEGYAEQAGDCNDGDDRFHPGADEEDCTDFNDYNCDGSVSYADADGDGFPACQECDDANPAVYPDAEEVCDGFDNNCDGEVDEGLTSSFYADADQDGYGDAESPEDACDMPEGYVDNNEDCDDDEATVYPMAWELCDGKDNDCDGLIDDDDIEYPAPPDSPPPYETPTWYLDGDQDGYGDDATVVVSCLAPDGYVENGGDCDDEDTLFHPEAPEEDCTDPNDYNCDGAVAYADEDDDGFLACLECDDTDPAVYPDAEEVCDEADNDCDGDVDEDVTSVFYLDADEDGYGDLETTIDACEPPVGYVDNDEDCSDEDALINPGSAEICDGTDNDCDDEVDEPDAVDAPAWYPDSDLDGYGVEEGAVVSCQSPEGFAALAGDCDDTDPAFHPSAPETDCTDPNDYNCDGSVAYSDNDGDGVPACEDCDDANPVAFPDAEEVCDTFDNDCDGAIDEDVTLLFYADADADGFGNADRSAEACAAPEGYVADSTDCNDQNAAINPAALETCNDKDDDCDGDVDESNAEGCTMIYLDDDGDGFGTDVSRCECSLELGWSSRSGDCDDTNPAVFPDATEKCNGYDDDCDGESDGFDAQGCTRLYADQDEDAYGSISDYECVCEPTGVYTAEISGDCNDNNATAYPNGPEVCDGVDNNCNGNIDEGVETTYYRDNDADGYGTFYDSKDACSAPDGYVEQGGDCNDFSNTISPGAPELCDNTDNNCNGQVDEGLAMTTVYKDNDGDGHGAEGISGVEACLSDADGDGVGETPPLDYSLVDDDCDDSDVTVFPGAPEKCDGKDNDCDSNVDKLCFEECEGSWPFRMAYSTGSVLATPADLNGDGFFEFIVQDNFGFAILDTDATPLFNYSAADHNYSRGAAVLADIDTYDQFNADTQGLEILTGNGSIPRFYKVNWAEGKTVTEYTLSKGVYDASRFMVADINYDRQVEFFTTTWCGETIGYRMFRFNKSTNTIEFVNDIPDPDNTCVYTDGRSITDLDDDGIPELIYGNGYAQATNPSGWGGHIYAYTLLDAETLSYDFFCPAGECFYTELENLYGGRIGNIFRVGDEIRADATYFQTNEPNVSNPSETHYWAYDIDGETLDGYPATERPALWFPTDVNDDGKLESYGKVREYGLWDVDGDGFPDMLSTSGTELRISLWDNDIEGFVEYEYSGMSISSANVSLRGIWDFDSNGRINVMTSDANGNVYCHELGANTWNTASSLPPHFPRYLRTYQWDNYEPNEGEDTDGDNVPDRFIQVASALTKKGYFYSYLSHPDDLDFYQIDASWGAQICLRSPRSRSYRLNVYSYYDRWNNETHEPTADGIKDGLIWSNATSAGGQTCFYGSSVTPYRSGEYRFVIGIESEDGYSPYWPYWISASK